MQYSCNWIRLSLAGKFMWEDREKASSHEGEVEEVSEHWGRGYLLLVRDTELDTFHSITCTIIMKY